jgi:hypothetical protein
MIVYDLSCPGGHRFEGWFGSSADYEGQRARGLVECPQCGSSEVAKAPMAPAVPAKSNQRAAALPPRSDGAPVPEAANLPVPPEIRAALVAIATAQAEALKQSTWVGESFADKSRAMHYGEEAPSPIHGQASLAEAKALTDEGVQIAPVLFPVAPPNEVN